MFLEQINKPNDIKSVMPEDYKLLAEEIREFLIEHISETGGHLASNLGTIELTMALHLVRYQEWNNRPFFQLPPDRQ